MVLDGCLLAGFFAVWLFFRERRTLALLAVLTALPLVRETGVAVTAGVALCYWVARQRRMAAAALLTAAPAAAWSIFVALRTDPAPIVLGPPLWPQIVRLFISTGPPFPPALELLNRVACVCLLLAFGWFAKALWDESRSGKLSVDVLLVLPSAILTAVATNPACLYGAYDFMRIGGVLIAWTAFRVVAVRPLWAALYMGASSAVLLAFRAGPVLRLLGR
jgi:hypothetical protein